MNGLLENKGILFIVKFIVLFAVLYGINVLFIGVTAPGGTYYSAFLNNYLNYIAWWRSLILHSSNMLAHLFGLNSFVNLPYELKTIDGTRVRMVYSCIGYGVTSFWVAFVLANEGGWRKKLVWSITGIVAIFIINCFRVTLLLMAFRNKWKNDAWIDHHTMFNIAAYVLIFSMIYLYTRNKEYIKPSAI